MVWYACLRLPHQLDSYILLARVRFEPGIGFRPQLWAQGMSRSFHDFVQIKTARKVVTGSGPELAVSNICYSFFLLAGSLPKHLSLIALLSFHFCHPASAKSSSTTKSLILNILAPSVSSTQSSNPILLTHIVAANHAAADNNPAAHPTRTCFPV